MRWNYICVALSEDRFVDSKRFQELLFDPRAYFSCFVIVELKRGGWLLTFQNSIIVKYNIYGLLSFEWLTLEYSIDDYLRLQCYAICLMAFDKTVRPFSMMFLTSTHFFLVQIISDIYKWWLTWNVPCIRVYIDWWQKQRCHSIREQTESFAWLRNLKISAKNLSKLTWMPCLRRTKFAWQEQNTVSKLQIFYCIKN